MVTIEDLVAYRRVHERKARLILAPPYMTKLHLSVGFVVSAVSANAVALPAAQPDLIPSPTLPHSTP